MKKYVIALGLIVLAAVAAASPFPRPANYSGNKGGGAPFLQVVGGPFDSLLVKRFSRHTAVTMDLAPWYSVEGTSRGDVLLELRKHNPKIKIFGYHLGVHWYLGPTFVPQPNDKSFPATWHKAILSTNGWLWTRNGVPVPNCEVDWSRQQVSDTLSSLLAQAASSHLFDGMFIDCFAWQLWWVNNTYPIDFQRSGFTSLAQMDSSRRANIKRTVERIKAAGGDGFIVIGNNGGDEQPWLDGDMREGYPTPLTNFRQATDWGLANSHRIWNWLQAGVYWPQSGTAIASDAIVTSCLFGTLVSVGPDRNLSVQPPYQGWWWDEYSVEPYPSCKADTTGKYVGWLGEPVSPPYLLPSGCWRRDFQNGIALKNPLSTTIDVDLVEANWCRIKGTQDPTKNNRNCSQVQTLRPYEGILMVAKVRRKP